MPLVNFRKDGLFNPEKPLFGDMIAGNYEEPIMVQPVSRLTKTSRAIESIWRDIPMIDGRKYAPSSTSPNISSTIAAMLRSSREIATMRPGRDGIPAMPEAAHDAITSALPQSAAIRPGEGPVIRRPA
jgi:hypothetical protein